MKTNSNPAAKLICLALMAGMAMTTGVPRVLADPPVKPASGLTGQGELTWGTDLPKALVQAKAEGKSVLLFFHGSDWCPPCVEMQRQVFASPEFIKYARRMLVLVEVDFPQKSRQSDELKQANLALKARFNLSPEAEEGFPTLVLLNGAGETVYQETGYAGGGAAEVLPKLERHTGTGEPTAAFKDLTVDEFARMAGDKQNVILDVRTPEEYQAGHIAGAVNLDVSAADFQAKAAALDRSKTYLVHCASGVRSVRACNKLNQLDFPNLYNLPGGFRAWVKAGQAVEK
ncbi:MAG: rhodanese-like domain-containing protein [Verrucomicrobiae bacterium]|nr:rhodanese-like domain-containing protein [Verrucomicrobiae bacterium]